MCDLEGMLDLDMCIWGWGKNIPGCGNIITKVARQKYGVQLDKRARSVLLACRA